MPIKWEHSFGKKPAEWSVDANSDVYVQWNASSPTRHSRSTSWGIDPVVKERQWDGVKKESDITINWGDVSFIYQGGFWTNLAANKWRHSSQKVWSDWDRPQLGEI